MNRSSTAILAPSATLRRLLLSSPVGPLLAEHDGEALRALRFWPQGAHPPAGTRVEPGRDDALGWSAAQQLREYFAGTRQAFDLPLALAGTPFQLRVWGALCQIPFGGTITYAELAEWVATRSARAVGQANGRNPLPIVVPCHRVLTAGGGLGGYLGAGAEGSGAAVKRWLLRREGVPGF